MKNNKDIVNSEKISSNEKQLNYIKKNNDFNCLKFKEELDFFENIIKNAQEQLSLDNKENLNNSEKININNNFCNILSICNFTTENYILFHNRTEKNKNNENYENKDKEKNDYTLIKKRLKIFNDIQNIRDNN